MGGEPLLSWDLLQKCVIFLRQTEPDILISLSTNGSLLTLSRYRFLHKHRVAIRLSFDGTPSAQDAHRKLSRGGPTSQVVMARISKIPLLERKGLSVHTVVCPDTISDLVGGCLFFSSLGIKDINFFPDLHGYLWDQKALKAFKRSMASFSDFYIALFRKQQALILRVGWLRHFLHRNKKIVFGQECLEDRMEACSSVWLGPEGIFYMCERAPLSTNAQKTFWKIGDTRKGIDMECRSALLSKVGRQVRKELGTWRIESRECFLCPFSFCLGASSAGMRKKRLKFYCDVLKIYLSTGMNIQRRLKTDPEFRKLYSLS